jgi:hypothetical protein
MITKTILNLSSPWMIHYHKLQAMFRDDPQVNVELNADNYEIKVYVSDADKAEALSKILKNSVDFGNITLKVTVIPPNYEDIDLISLYKKAFEGNKAFVEVKENPLLNRAYTIFKGKVVQYFSDDLSDANQVCSTLYQYIAKDVFVERGGMNFSTEICDDIIK